MGYIVDKYIDKEAFTWAIDILREGRRAIYLSSSIILSISAENDVVFVKQDEPFNVYGQGEDIGQAINNMMSAAIAKYDLIKDKPLDDMSPNEREIYRKVSRDGLEESWEGDEE